MSKRIREVWKIDLFNYLFFPSVIIAGLSVGFVYLRMLKMDFWLDILVIVIFALLLDIVGRFFLIGLVLLYKAFAPMSIRDRCRFEPSCSTYMVICLRKFGCFFGLIKGLLRITRCHYPNGGYDYPKHLFEKHK